MKLSIKVGPFDWKEHLEKAHYDAIEVAYNANKEANYVPLFQFIKDNHVHAGLHFWGTFGDHILPSLAIDEPDIIDGSLALCKKSIDTAATWNFDYILFHISTYDVWKLSDDKRLTIEPTSTSEERGWQLFKENVQILNEYATRKGVRLVVEEIGNNEFKTWIVNTINLEMYRDIRVPTIDNFRELGVIGIPLCLDIAHLAIWFAGEKKRAVFFQKVKAAVLNLKPYVSVLHIASLLPPFTADTQNGFTPEEDAAGVFPSSREVLALLAIFEDTDIIVVPEPQIKDHLWHNTFLRQSGLFSKKVIES